jgi:hypothetical protein
MKNKLPGLMLSLLVSGFTSGVVGQTADSLTKTALLQSRHRDDVAGIDNYEYATFSFLVGQNGPEAKKLTRNDWDVSFFARTEAQIKRDYFDVTMVVDDRSRIVDLGFLGWGDPIELPELPAYEKPTREKSVEAKIGHMYYVHTADRDSDHYALFRVEEMKSGVNVSISWKLLGKPVEGSK